LIFVDLGKLAYCLNVQVGYDNVFGSFLDIKGVALFICDEKFDLVVWASA